MAYSLHVNFAYLHKVTIVPIAGLPEKIWKDMKNMKKYVAEPNTLNCA